MLLVCAFVHVFLCDQMMQLHEMNAMLASVIRAHCTVHAYAEQAVFLSG